jgi:hypothetical protein
VQKSLKLKTIRINLVEPLFAARRSFVRKHQSGEPRIDLMEFILLVWAFGADSAELFQDLNVRLGSSSIAVDRRAVEHRSFTSAVNRQQTKMAGLAR